MKNHVSIGGSFPLYEKRKENISLTKKKKLYKLSMDDICCCQLQEKENIKNKKK